MGRIVVDMRWWLSFSAIFVFCGHARAATLHEEMVPMRDGVRLFTRAMIPGEGKHPCVFSRTPYPRGNALKSPYPQELVDGDVCVRHGYVSVGQHCRGFG